MWYSLKSRKTHKKSAVLISEYLVVFRGVMWFVGDKSPILNFCVEQLSRLKAQEGDERVGELHKAFPCPLELQGVNHFFPLALLNVQAQC